MKGYTMPEDSVRIIAGNEMESQRGTDRDWLHTFNWHNRDSDLSLRSEVCDLSRISESWTMTSNLSVVSGISNASHVLAYVLVYFQNSRYYL